MNKLQLFFYKIKYVLRNAHTYKFNPSRLIGGILFIVAWVHGDVSGWLAWAILLLFLDFEVTWTRR